MSAHWETGQAEDYGAGRPASELRSVPTPEPHRSPRRGGVGPALRQSRIRGAPAVPKRSSRWQRNRDCAPADTSIASGRLT